MSTDNEIRQEKLIGDTELVIYEIVNFVAIVNVIALFGVVANVMNMVVFYKQGFKNNMNISFFWLALSDLCGLISLLWGCLFLSSMFIQPDVTLDREEVFYLTTATPHSIFSRITGWITVYITAERCLCITLPLKIKKIITPRRTQIIVCVIYLVMMANILPEYGTVSLGNKFYPGRNMTLTGLIFSEYCKVVEAVIYVIYSILGSASFVVITVLTVVLIVQLKHRSKWRTMANVGKESCEVISTRDRKTMVMVVMIATVLVVCYIPGVALSLVTFIEPQFSIAGIFVNAFWAFWSFAFIFDAVNSSINIILYYKMSSKYRETFNQLFGFYKH